MFKKAPPPASECISEALYLAMTFRILSRKHRLIPLSLLITITNEYAQLLKPTVGRLGELTMQMLSFVGEVYLHIGHTLLSFVQLWPRCLELFLVAKRTRHAYV